MTTGKRPPAVETQVVVENPLINDFTEFCASDTTCRCACQSAENGASYSANGDTWRAGDDTDNSANLGPGHDTCGPLGGTTDSADEGTDFPGDIFGHYGSRLAARTMVGHEQFPFIESFGMRSLHGIEPIKHAA
jgi:hypothetical protein